MKSEIKDYVVWRRKTRFIRHYGGLMLAGAFIVATVLVLWRAQMKRYETPQEPAHKLHSMMHLKHPRSHG